MNSLLGEENKNLYDVGVKGFVVYQYLRGYSDRMFRERGWDWRSKPDDFDDLTPLSVKVDAREFNSFMDIDRLSDFEHILESLYSNDWIWDYQETSNHEYFVVTAILDSEDKKVFSFDYNVLNSSNYIPSKEKSKNSFNKKESKRKSGIEELINNTKEKTESVRQKYKKRREKRDKQNFEEARKNQFDEDPFDPDFEKTKPGILKMYKTKFEREMGVSPIPLYTSGKPNAHAKRLFQYVKDYDMDLAMKAISYAIEEWEEISKVKGWSGPPSPQTLSYVRHELCFAFQKGEDPIDYISGEKEHSEDINSDEWDSSEQTNIDGGVL